MTAGDRPLAVLTEASEHGLSVLRRGIKRAAGFVLYVVVTKDLGRVELLRRLKAWSGVGGFPELRFFPQGEEGARAVGRFLAEKDEEHPPAGVVIQDGAAMLDADAGGGIAALNVARDILYKVVRGPLLLLVPPDREGDLARRAPDLFDVRAGTVAVEGMAVEAGEVELARIGYETDAPARPMVEIQIEAARLRALGKTDDPPLGALADAWVRLGKQFLARGESGEAKQAAHAAQGLAERIGYGGGVAAGTALEGDVALHLGDLDGARVRYGRALAIYEDLGDRMGVAALHGELGNVALVRGELDEAQDSYEKSLVISEELGHHGSMASSYHDFGRVAQLRGELDEAHDWYEKSLTIEVAFGDLPGMASSYHELGIVAQKRGELDEAQIWYHKSIAIDEELGNGLSAASYHQLGRVAQERGELDEAQAWYEKSLTIEEELGNRSGMATSYGQLGLLAERRDDLPQALDWTVRAVTLFPEFPHPMTGPAPHILARLTAVLGMPALEATWQRITGQPLPGHVRAHVEP
jgi:tetratricopeptide (TPR) repeat protein